MSLIRTTSGLIARDDFDTDTSANYTEETGFYDPDPPIWTFGSGVATTQAPDATEFWTMQTAKTGTPRCATVRIKGDQPNLAIVETWADGGLFYCVGVSERWFEEEEDFYVSMGISESGWEVVASVSVPCTPSPDGYYFIRLYVDDDDVLYSRTGATDLSVNCSGSPLVVIEPSPDAFGGYTGDFNGGGPPITCDWREARTSHLVTVTDLPTGYWVKVSDGTTTAKAEESSGTATVDAGAVLFPLASVAVYDGDPDDGGELVESLDTGDYADMGGGDAFEYSADAAGGLLPFMIQPQYHPAFGGLTYG